LNKDFDSYRMDVSAFVAGWDCRRTIPSWNHHPSSNHGQQSKLHPRELARHFTHLGSDNSTLHRQCLGVKGNAYDSKHHAWSSCLWIFGCYFDTLDSFAPE
jgi:hypothetical protein